MPEVVGSNPTLVNSLFNPKKDIVFCVQKVPKPFKAKVIRLVLVRILQEVLIEHVYSILRNVSLRRKHIGFYANKFKSDQ